MAYKRVKPSEPNARRMYLRSPTKKYLVIAAKTVDDAVRPLAAQRKRKIQTGAVLSARTEIIAMPAGYALPVKAAKPANLVMKNIKAVKALVLDKSRTAPGTSRLDVKPKSNTPGPLTSKTTDVKVSKASNILPYDGQPRFEGGMRFFQGGLPELGKRR